MELPGLRPLEGGWSGETFVAGADGERQVVRIYVRNPGRAEVDAALLRLVRGLLPVPEVLEVRRPDAELPGLLVTAFLPGVRGDLLISTLDEAGLRRLGHAVGELVARLGGMPMPKAGELVDADLTIRPFDLPDGLPGFVATHAWPQWSADERAGLNEVAERAQDLLDGVDRTALVHSDVNPKNLLVDPGSLEVTGLVDWEYAHAGNPFADLGNVLRFDRHPAYIDAVLTVYADRLGTASGAALELARAADLWSLVDLAARAGENPVAARADRLLRVIALRRDLHEPPPGG